MIAVSRSSRTPQSAAIVPETIQRNSGWCCVTPSKLKNTIQDRTQATNSRPVATDIAPFSLSHL